MRDVADALRSVARLDFCDGGVVGGEVIAEHGEELIEVYSFAAGDVIDAIDGLGFVGKGGQLVGLDDVVDVGEVPGEAAVAIDDGAFVAHEFHHEEGNDGSVGAVGILSAAKDVEVTQADGLGAIEIAKVRSVEFVDVLGDGIGREGLANLIFDLGQAGAVAIGGAAGRIDKALDTGFLGRPEHVHKAGDVHIGGGHGVGDGTRDRAQRGLMQHVVDAIRRAAAGVAVAYIAHHEPEGGIPHEGQQILHLARGEVVQHQHLVVLCQQRLNQVGADEARPARDQNTALSNNSCHSATLLYSYPKIFLSADCAD